MDPVIEKAQNAALALRRIANYRAETLSATSGAAIRDGGADAMADLAELVLMLIGDTRGPK